MASTIDPTIWDMTGDIAKSTIKEKLATAAKNDIEALQTTVEGLTGDAVVMPESTIRGRLSAGTGAAENLTPEEVMSLLGLGDGAGATPDGRTILEVGAITDASAEFLSGATFTLDPTNARHYNVQVGDSTTPLTAGMTVALSPASASWPATAQVIVTKGDASTYSITISGLNADGLGTATLVDQYEGVILGYHNTDGANGPGAAGQKWKIVARFTRTRRTDVQSVIDAGSYLQHGDVFPEPGLVESVAGAFVLDWETDFDGPRIVKLVRAAGDVSESLLVTLPETPSGDWATVLVTEPMVFQAPNRTFSIAASWTDTLGVGTFTITESGVTTATLALAPGDVVSGGPFGSPTTIATIESDSVFTTTDPCGETDSGTVSIVAPAYSIDGARQFTGPASGDTGVLLQFIPMSASTATTLGEIKTPERMPGAAVLRNGAVAGDIGDVDLDVAASPLVEVFVSAETLTGDMALTPLTTGLADGRLIIIQRTGNDDIYTFSVAGLVYPGGGTIAIATGEALLCHYVAGVGLHALGIVPITLATGGGSDATFEWEEVELTGDTSITVADHAAFADASGVIKGRTIKIRRSSDATATLTFPNAPGDFALWRVQIDDAYTSAVVLSRNSAGAINGANSVTLAPVQGATVDIWLQSQATGPDVPAYTARGDLAEATTLYGAMDANGRAVSGNLGVVVTRGAASSQPTATDSGKYITSDGALTVPAVAGWNCMLEFGGDHDLTFAGDVWDTGAAAGDIVSIFVKSATVIRITPIILAADVITEADFA